MTINLSVPQTMQELRPRITVIGVGGAGCNAVNNMIDANLEGVDFLVANTDGQSLAHSLAPRKLQLGTSLTGGLGAGSKPEIGRKAAEESIDDVLAELADSNMIFITAGMGGGTGTGAAPVIARAAKERGILTVGVVTKPFDFEGKRRMEQADQGVDALQGYVDTLIVIPNQNLFRLANERTTLADTFHMADAVLHQGVCGVTDLMIKPGLINLDFADIRAVMSEMGKAMMGTGEASGETRAIDAAESAINNPLLDDSSMKGARAVLINITGGMDMTLFEVDEAANRIRSEVDPDATIIFGSAFDEKLEGVMRVSVVATGIDAAEMTTPLPFMQDQSEAISMPVSGATGASETELADKQISSDVTPEVADTPHELDHAAPTDDSADPAIADSTADIDEQQLDIETLANSRDHSLKSEQGAEQDAAQDAPQEAQDNHAEIARKGHEQAKIIRRPSFIPDEAKQVESDEEVNATDIIAESQQRPSLINKISGLWGNRSETDQEDRAKEEPVSAKEEPVLATPATDTDEAANIVDLPKADAVQPHLPVNRVSETQAETDDDLHDDELDIPAFLRRQAN